MTNIFAVSDIHGCSKEFEELLKSWNPDRERLVLLGDYVDRGPDSLGVLKRAMGLQREYGAVVLGGNHEELFLSFIESPDETFPYYVRNGGWPTVVSMVPDELLDKRGDLIAAHLHEKYRDILSFVRDLPDYYEEGRHVFVHAGVDLQLMNWKNTRPSDFRWIRDPFHYGRNESEHVFVFGHTPTSYLHADRSGDVWFSPCKTKIGIDGGVSMNGVLHGLKITGEVYEVFTQPSMHTMKPVST